MTRTVRSPYWCLALVSLCLGCAGSQTEAPEARRGVLPAGAVAEVEGELITAEHVAQVVRAQGVTPTEARELAVSDALFGLHARRELSPAAIRVVERAERARAFYRQLQIEVDRQGPATEAELARASAEHWLRVDRPVSSRTSHAVVRLLKGVSEAQAREVADRILEAVRGSEDAEAFERRAKEVATDGLDVRVEALPAVTVDGRVIDLERPAPPDMRFDLAFSQAANTITEVGQLSPVTRTPFGFHVIYLVERLPAVQLSVEEKRVALADVIQEHRVRQAEQAVLSRGSAVEVSRAAESLTAELQRTP
ncbi:MAG: peptidyl-prolyl cis-trans isomerase [Polyangiaceae bacterium]|nr:peptidyl-prolyl cis-trans isomerase [Polyangiaceae bacterium]MCW5789810.1 peptidyl-prolyl cis-trans isomerase [Polyangiaceae bacterium]